MYVSRDIWKEIIKYASLDDLLSLRSICKFLRVLIDESELCIPTIPLCELLKLHTERLSLGWGIFGKATVLPRLKGSYSDLYVLPDGMTNITLRNIKTRHELNHTVKLPPSLKTLCLCETLLNEDQSWERVSTNLKSLTIALSDDKHSFKSKDVFKTPKLIPTSITDLYLMGTEYKDDFVSHLCNLKTLKLVQNNAIKGTCVESGRLDCLETLHLHYGKSIYEHRQGRREAGLLCLEKDIQWIESLPKSLTSLTLINVLIYSHFQGVPKPDVMRLPPRLRKLSIHLEAGVYSYKAPTYSGPPTALLNGITDTLTELDFTKGYKGSVNDDSMSKVFLRTTNLVSLKLVQCAGIKGPCLQHLPTTLRKLNLNRSLLEEKALTFLSPFIPLSCLRVGYTDIDEASLFGLLRAQPKKLSKLEISRCHEFSFRVVPRLFGIGLAGKTRYTSEDAYGNAINGWGLGGSGAYKHIKFCLENGLYGDDMNLYDSIASIVTYNVGKDFKPSMEIIHNHLSKTGFLDKIDRDSVSLCPLMRAFRFGLGSDVYPGTTKKPLYPALYRIKALVKTFNIKVKMSHIKMAHVRGGVEKGGEIHSYLLKRVKIDKSPKPIKPQNTDDIHTHESSYI